MPQEAHTEIDTLRTAEVSQWFMWTALKALIFHQVECLFFIQSPKSEKRELPNFLKLYPEKAKVDIFKIYINYRQKNMQIKMCYKEYETVQR